MFDKACSAGSLPPIGDFDPAEHLRAANERAARRDARFAEVEDRLAGRASRIAAETYRLLQDVAEMDADGIVTAPDTIEQWVA